jgi:ribosomal subunit interface protein
LRVSIAGRSVELDEDIKAYAREKVEKIERYFDGVIQAQVVLSPEFVTAPDPAPADGAVNAGGAPAEDRARIVPEERVDRPEGASGHCAAAEIVMNVPGSPPFVARARGEGYRAAVDTAADKMERQLRRHKEKLVEHRRGGRPPRP